MWVKVMLKVMLLLLQVKVMLRICPPPVETTTQAHSSSVSFLSLDARKKQISVTDPTMYQGFTTPSLRRPMAPRLFEFDSVFTHDNALTEVCATGLVDILQSVVNGNDGCLFCYGHARLGEKAVTSWRDASLGCGGTQSRNA